MCVTKAADAVIDGWNQYPPRMGLPELRAAVAAHYKRFQDLDLDPDAEIMVTSGATEALAGALLALIEPGDEVVLFQPMYDAYLPLVKRAGGVPRFVTLQPPAWRFAEADLAAVFSDRTRVVLFNNPLNPAGVVYDREALALLARFCVKHDAIAVCDEVWEHVVFDGRAHVPLFAMPGMRERTVKIGSAGKIFSLTGWKVGFVCAAPSVMKALAKAHQFITFTTPPNLQSAVAYGPRWRTIPYFAGMRAELAAAAATVSAKASLSAAFRSFRARAPISSISISPRSAKPTISHSVNGSSKNMALLQFRSRPLRRGCRKERGAFLLRREGCDAG